MLADDKDRVWRFLIGVCAFAASLACIVYVALRTEEMVVLGVASLFYTVFNPVWTGGLPARAVAPIALVALGCSILVSASVGPSIVQFAFLAIGSVAVVALTQHVLLELMYSAGVLLDLGVGAARRLRAR